MSAESKKEEEGSSAAASADTTVDATTDNAVAHDKDVVKESEDEINKKKKDKKSKHDRHGSEHGHHGKKKKSGKKKQNEEEKDVFAVPLPPSKTSSSSSASSDGRLPPKSSAPSITSRSLLVVDNPRQDDVEGSLPRSTSSQIRITVSAPTKPGGSMMVTRSISGCKVGDSVPLSKRMCSFKGQTMTVAKFLSDAKKANSTHTIWETKLLCEKEDIEKAKFHRSRSLPALKKWKPLVEEEDENDGLLGASLRKAQTLVGSERMMTSRYKASTMNLERRVNPMSVAGRAQIRRNMGINDGEELNEEDEKAIFARLGNDVNFGSKNTRVSGKRNLLRDSFSGGKTLTKEQAVQTLFTQLFRVFETEDEMRDYITTIVLSHTFIMTSTDLVTKLIAAYKMPAAVRKRKLNGVGEENEMPLTTLSDIRVRALRCLLLWARLIDEFPVDSGAVKIVTDFICDFGRSDLPAFSEECTRRLLPLMIHQVMGREFTAGTLPPVVQLLHFMLSPKHAPLEWNLTDEQLIPPQKAARREKPMLVHSSTVTSNLDKGAMEEMFDRSAERSNERTFTTSPSKQNLVEVGSDSKSKTPTTKTLRLKGMLRRASLHLIAPFSPRGDGSSSASSSSSTASSASSLSSNSSSPAPSSPSQPDHLGLSQSGGLSKARIVTASSEPKYSAAERNRLLEALVSRIEKEETTFTAHHLMMFWEMSEKTRTFDKDTFCGFTAKNGIKDAVDHCQVSEELVVKLANVLISKKQIKSVLPDQPFEKDSEAVFCITSEPPRVADHSPLFPNVLDYVETAAGFMFMGIPPEEIARQLTLYEHELFRSINLSELTNTVWQDEKLRDEKAAHVVSFSDFSNRISAWAASEIVLASDLKIRTEILEHMIQLADACLKLQNFNAFLEIMIGLMNPAIVRLKQTWAALSPSMSALHARLKELANPLPNYAKYRGVLRQSVLPFIPSLSVILIDLVQIDLCSKLKKDKGKKKPPPSSSTVIYVSGKSGNNSGTSRSPFSTLASPPPDKSTPPPVPRSPFSTLSPTSEKPKQQKPLEPSPSALKIVEEAANEVDLQRLSLHAEIFRSILNVKGCFYTLKRVDSIINYLKRVYVVPETTLLNYSRLCEPDEQIPSSSDSIQNGSHVLV